MNVNISPENQTAPTCAIVNSAQARINQWLHSLCPMIYHDIRASVQKQGTTRDQRLETRRLEFELGRNCAAKLLTQLGEHEPVGVYPDRSPQWPALFAGSISHSDHWTWASVARKTDARSLGVDTEPFIHPETRMHIQSEIVNRSELERIVRVGLNEDEAFTVAFSAKEAIYKCCYPLVQDFFGFDQAMIDHVTSDSLLIQLNKANPRFDLLPCHAIRVHFQLVEKNVFTFCWLD